MRLLTTTPLRTALAALALMLAASLPAAGVGLPAVEATPSATTVDELLASANAGELRPLQAALPRIDSPGLEALVGARLAAARLDTPAVDAQLARYRASDDRTPARDAMAWSIAADAAFAAGHYARAAGATQAWAELLAATDGAPGDSAEVAQFHGIAAMLASLPSQQVVERQPRPSPTRRDKAGLLRTTVRINGLDQDAVLDTGANLSVISSSTAERLGIRILDAEGSVGSGSRDAVATRIGVAERLEIAGITVSNVAFLVLADSALEMPLPGGYRIDAIIGFPVLRAIGRMRFADGAFVALAPAAPSAADAPGNLHAVGNDLFVDATVDGIPVALHLDTGAPASSLSTRFARRHPERLRGLERRERRSASAGGAITQQSAVWQDVGVAIDGHPVTLPGLHVMLTDAAAVETRTSGTLGLDVLDRYDACTLDLESMRLEVTPMPARPELPAAGPAAPGP